MQHPIQATILQFDLSKFSSLRNVDLIWEGVRASNFTTTTGLFSEHQNCLFSSSLLHHQNVKSVFLVHHYIKIDKDHNVESVFLVHHFYNKNQTFDVLILPMASKKITTSKIKISTTYGILPMVTKAWGSGSQPF